MYLGSKITNQYGEGYIVSNVDPHNIKVVYEKTGDVKYFCKVRNCNCKEKYGFTSIHVPQNFKSDLFQTNIVLKNEITKMRKSLEEKNKSLDALHYVWCSGGCEGGVHRYSESKITEELVSKLEQESRRLRSWYENYKFRNLSNNEKILYFKSWKHKLRMLLNYWYWKLL